jgi:hypothetical protein
VPRITSIVTSAPPRVYIFNRFLLAGRRAWLPWPEPAPAKIRRRRRSPAYSSLTIVDFRPPGPMQAFDQTTGGVCASCAIRLRIAANKFRGTGHQQHQDRAPEPSPPRANLDDRAVAEGLARLLDSWFLGVVQGDRWGLFTGVLGTRASSTLAQAGRQRISQ